MKGVKKNSVQGFLEGVKKNSYMGFFAGAAALTKSGKADFFDTPGIIGGKIYGLYTPNIDRRK